MKLPESREEYLVWPPLGSGIGVFIGATAHGVFTPYHDLILSQQGDAYYAGYFFPVVMAIAFAARLHGKYWLGFAWVGVIAYTLSWILSLFNLEDGVGASTLMVCSCLSIMFAVQAGLLFIKRRYWRVVD